MLNRLFIIIAVILLFSSVQLFAVSNRAGTNAASELLIPVGAKYIAMGGASVAGVTGLEAIYWNPAGLDRLSYGAGAMFSQMSYIADINVNYLGLGVRFEGIGTVGLSFKTLSIGDIAITTADAPDGTGEMFSPQFMTIGVTYSRALTDRVSVGGTGKIISETMDRVSATGFALDIGVQYSGLANVRGLNIGVALKNLGPGIQFDGNGLIRKADPNDTVRPESPMKIISGTDELPSTMEIGLSYNLKINDQNKVMVESMFINHNYQDDGALMGAEFSFMDMFFLRGGYTHALNAGEDATGASVNIFGMSLGAGFHYDLGGFDLMIDYAYRDVEYFSGNNVFTVKLGF
ncbi:PorV/PorQ family protein [candidate division KSB1 bacterium]|nr:PorV/PorQ family protein [candidate division KSB1 bacterium]